MNAPGDYRELLLQATRKMGELQRLYAASERARSEPIAIVGMGCRFPGGVNSPAEFWELLTSGRDAVSEIPPERWDVESLYDADPNRAGTVYTRHAALLDQRTVEDFDPLFFGIAPREAVAMDPQQRLLLEVCSDALEHAGIPAAHLRGTATGLYVGMCTDDYLHLHNNVKSPQRIDGYTSLGTARSIAIGRVSYLFGWEGPAIQLDTACSSALMAVHLACQNLRAGECDVALAGAVNLQLSPVWTVGLCRLKALSPDGRCRAFDADANGFVRGEGCGIVVLKRLSDAERDRDPILAVVRGAAVNHDGKSGGLTVPNERAQQKLLAAALANAKLKPEEVDYIEAHGTGTLLGDPIEMGALKSVYAASRTAARPLLVGSVKTNIGHLEGAAGVAGLMKVVLAMQHGRLPGSLHFHKPNPLIPWQDFAVSVPTRNTPWPAENGRRIAGISAFGFSGTNVHLVVESSPREPALSVDENLGDRPVHVLPLSAKTRPALRKLAQSFEKLLADHRDESLADWAYSAGTGRSHFGQRMALVAETTDEARTGLAEFLADSTEADHAAVVSGEIIADPQVAWLFPGEDQLNIRGAIRFYARNAAFRQAWDECCRLANRSSGDEFAALTNPDATLWDRWLASPATALPLLFMHQHSLAQMWFDWGVKPKLVAGRGVGAYVAAVAAGVMSLEDGLKLVIAEGRSRSSGLPADFEAVVRTVRFQDRRLPILSDVTGTMAGPEIGTVDYWFRRAAQPFAADFITPLCTHGMTLALELGPRGSFAGELPGVPWVWSLSPKRDASLDDDFAAVAHGVAELYVHGVDVDWLRFDADFPRRRRELPTYPFQRVRLWLDPDPELTPSLSSANAGPSQSHQTSHPLLGERIESAADIQLFQLHVTSQTEGLWRDHAIYGQPVLPATGFLELMLAAAVKTPAGSDVRWEIRNLSIEKALKLPAAPDGGTPDPDVTVQTILSPAESGWECGVYSRQAGETTWTKHATARVMEAEPETERPNVDLSTLRARCPQKVALDAQYAEFQRTGLELGPRFRALQEVFRGDGETLSEILLPECLLSKSDDYRVHPVLLDAALQGLSAVIPRAGMYLPVGVERLTLYAPLGTSVWSHARLNDPQTETSRGFTVELKLFNDAGQLLCVMEGVQFREVPRESLGRTRAADLSSQRYQLAWRPKPLVGESRLTHPGRWLILDDETGIGAMLAKLLRLAGHQCLQIVPGAEAGPLIEDRVVLPAHDADAWSDFLRVQNGKPKTWTGIVHLWGLRKEFAADANISALNPSLTCGAMLTVVQALARNAESPRLCLVSRCGQAVSSDSRERIDVGQAPLWGLGRVVALEHPELNCQCIDVDDLGPGECAEILWREIQSADGENQVAYRQSERLAARLIPLQANGAKLSIPEHPFRVQLPTYGMFEQLRAAPISRRAPQAGEVELEVRAAGLNFRDVLRAQGMLRALEITLGIHSADATPFGFEAAGVITAVADDVTNFAVGDEVVVLEAGALASHMTVSARHVVRKPAVLTLTEAAAVPLAFVTAYHALVELGRIQAGQRVLIHAAAGGVGLAAVQLALSAGADVYATASPAKWDTLKSMGVRLVANSRTTDFAEEILRATDGAGVDIVLNSLNGDFIPASVKTLAPGGTFLEIGKLGIWTAEQMAQIRPDIAYHAFDLGDEEAKAPGFNGQRLAEVLDRFQRRELTPLPITGFPVTDVSSAFQWMSRARHVGKVVVTFTPADVADLSAHHFGAGTYLVTGGLGGLGLQVSQWLAQQGVKSLALVGRRPAETPEQRRVLTDLEQQGCTVRCYAADISLAEDVARLLQAIQTEMPPLTGVLHAAGVLDDGALRNQTWPRCEAVFAPKALGAWHLHQQTMSLPLKHFVMFSSAVSLIGSAGQANYAAANAFVDALAHARRQTGLPALAINWGAWKGTGMAAQLGVRERERLASQGLGLIDPVQGLQQLGVLMSESNADNVPPQVALLPIDWNRYSTAVGRHALWSDLVGDIRPGPTSRSEFLNQWVAAPPSDRARLMNAFVHGQLAKVLGLDPAQPLTANQGFFDLGMDSLTSVEFANRLQDSLGCKLPATVAFDYPTINDLSEFLMNSIVTPPDQSAPPISPQPLQAAAPEAKGSCEEGIAIIGMSCRFPGCDSGPDAYWNLIVQGGDGVCDVPKDRWDADRLTDPNPDTPGKMSSRKGGFLKDPLDQFDAAFFGISPREARSLDPQQRLLMETAYEALEDAGLPWEAVEKSATGVFVGIAGNDGLLLFSRNKDAIDAYLGTGTTHSTAAGRLSYTFGFHGPAISVDTACSSGLVAVHLACQSLKSGECDMAVAAAVNVVIAPEICINFSKAKMLSPDGQCKSFDASANGYVRGEGVGTLLLKPLAKAQADGNRILAVIRGSAINQDGRSGGLTVPSGPAQEAVLRQALHFARLTPDDVDYLEAHGTGTPLGDPIELGAIAAVYRSRQGEPLTVASVKANIGHLETASGIAGLIKVIQALRHETIPQQLHFQQPNPKIDWSQLPITVPKAARPWPAGPRRRIAGVSAFGFSGTNAHVIVEEPPESLSRTHASNALERPLQLLPLSGKTEAALKQLAERYRARLADCSDEEFANLCHTAATGRTHYAYRLAVTAANASDMIGRLDRYLAGEADPLCQTGYIGDAPQIAFLFTGQGSQYVGMGQLLFETQPTFRKALERCDELLRPHLAESLLSVLFSATPNGLLDQTAYTQPALFSLEYALFQMWNSWGIHPSVMLGHSVGEYAAACAAGVLSLEDALSLIATRARLIQSLPAGGGMLAVMAQEDLVQPIVQKYHPRVSFAAINGPRQVVLSGPIPLLDQLAGELADAGVASKRLVVSHAFHSSLMEPILSEFHAAAAAVRFSPPQIPIISNVTAQPVTSQSVGGELQTAEYWSSHLRQAVQFVRSVQELSKSSCDVLLEIGPQPTLLGMAKQSLSGDKYLSLPSLKPRSSDWETLLTSLGQLYVQGANVDWAGFDRDYRRRQVDVPHYCFQRQRHWPEWLTPELVTLNLVGLVTGKETAATKSLPAAAKTTNEANPSVPAAAATASATAAGHPLLGGQLQLAGGQLVYQVELSDESPAFLADHSVFGRPLFPGTGYLETALAAGHQLPGTQPVLVEDLELLHGLPLPKGVTATVQIVLDGSGEERRLQYFSRSAQAAAAAPWQLHATAKIRRGDLPAVSATNLDAIRRRCSTVYEIPEFYADFLKAGLQYGPCFQGITQLRGGASEAIGDLTLPASLSQEAAAYYLHPALLDSALQVIAAAIDGTTATYLPVGLESLRFYRSLPKQAVCHVRLRDPDATDAAFLLVDLKVLDTAGQALAVLQGMKLKRVALPSAAPPSTPTTKPAAAQRVDWLHEFAWRAQPLAKESSADGTSGSWLVFADDSDVGILLANRLEERGARCMVVRNGPEYRRLNGNQFEVNPADPAGFQRLLQDAVGPQQPRLQGVAFLWGLTRTTDDVAEPMEAVQLICGGVLHLVQAVMKTENRPRLCLVTRGGQGVTGQESVIAAETALWGMGRVVAAECPDLRCTRIDLDPAANEASAVQMLMKDLLPGDEEDQLAYRNGSRYAARLMQQSAKLGRLTVPSDAYRLKLAEYGSLDQFSLTPTDRVAPGPGEIEVVVDASGLNFRDVLRALGMLQAYEVPLGITSADKAPFGFEFAGRVAAVGPGVTDLSVGDDVFGVNSGTLRSHLVCSARHVVRKPNELSATAAASIPLAYLTATYGLDHLARIKPGEKVLIHAAAGGVGQAAVQIAQRAGAVIYATASPGKWDFLRQQGIEHIFDSRSTDFGPQVLAATDGQGVDVILNSLNGEFIPASVAALAQHGRFVEIGKIGIWTAEQMASSRPDVTYGAFDLGELEQSDPGLMQRMLNELMPDFISGKLRPLPTHVYSVEDAVAAFREMQQAKHRGKLVVAFAPQLVDDRPLVRGDASYLITGGLGALGLSLADRLVQRGARHLVLAGRSGAESPDQQAAIAHLESAGAKVSVVKANTSEATDIARVIAAAQSLAPLKGVFHAAGLLDDGLLSQQSWSRFERVIRPKAVGAWQLHLQTRNLDLDHFVTFSSAAAMIGSFGQSNYAAGNAFLDGLAWRRRSAGLPAVSINWGPWGGRGMAARMDQKDLDRMKQSGWGLIGIVEGLDLLERILRGTSPQVGVLPVDWPVFLGLTGVPPMLRDMAVHGQPAEKSSFVTELETLNDTERRELMSNFVRDRIASVLGSDNADWIQPRDRLFDLGMDSLTAVELQNTLQRELGLILPTTMAFDFPTIEALAEYLAARVMENATAEPVDETPTAPTPPLAEVPRGTASATTPVEVKPFASTFDVSSPPAPVQTAASYDEEQQRREVEDMTDEEISALLLSKFSDLLT